MRRVGDVDPYAIGECVCVVDQRRPQAIAARDEITEREACDGCASSIVYSPLCGQQIERALEMFACFFKRCDPEPKLFRQAVNFIRLN